MSKVGRCCCIALGLFVCLSGPLAAQTAVAGAAGAHEDKKALVVNGHRVPGAVVQISGRSYVDVESLAQATNASINIRPDQVILTIPGLSSASPSPEADTGISKGFAKAGITALAALKDWKAAILGVIRQGVFAGTWLTPYLREYQNRAENSLDQASVAAATSSDQQTVQLLKNQFANVKAWDAKTQAAVKNLEAAQTVNASAQKDDTLLTKINDCDTFLSGMIVGHEFADSPSCH